MRRLGKLKGFYQSNTPTFGRDTCCIVQKPHLYVAAELQPVHIAAAGLLSTAEQSEH